MATNPTRRQAQARDQLADILNFIATSVRLDGNPGATPKSLDDLAKRVGDISSAFSLDEIVARALEKRAIQLGLASGVAEMLTLLDSDITPLRMLWLDDERFKAQIQKIEDELGEV